MLKPLEHILNVPVYKPGKPIEELKRELNLSEIIKLASNENPFGCSLFVKRAVEKEAVNIHRYPDGGAYYLKKELSKFLEVPESQIIIGNGSNDILDMIARAFLDKNSEVLMFEYSFVVYKIVSLIQGAKIKEVPVECDFSRNLQKLIENITDKTKVIFIDNPCNPTGVANKKEEFDEFIKKALAIISNISFEPFPIII
jgi:histidinol-phosphate aminotransferase